MTFAYSWKAPWLLSVLLVQLIVTESTADDFSAPECAEPPSPVLETIDWKELIDVWGPLTEDDSLQSQFCAKDDAGTLVCTVDLKRDYPADFELYLRACSSVGYKIYSNDYIEICSGFSITVPSTLVCLPQTCTLSDVRARFVETESFNSTWFGTDYFDCNSPSTQNEPIPVDATTIDRGTADSGNDRCVQETANTFYPSHPSLFAAFQALSEKDDLLHDDFSSFCRKLHEDYEDYYCVKDFDTLPQARAYEMACSEADGVLATMTNRTFVCEDDGATDLIVEIHNSRLCGSPNACGPKDGITLFSVMMDEVETVGVRLGSEYRTNCVDLGGGPILFKSAAFRTSSLVLVVLSAFSVCFSIGSLL